MHRASRSISVVSNPKPRSDKHGFNPVKETFLLQCYRSPTPPSAPANPNEQCTLPTVSRHLLSRFRTFSPHTGRLPDDATRDRSNLDIRSTSGGRRCPPRHLLRLPESSEANGPTAGIGPAGAGCVTFRRSQTIEARHRPFRKAERTKGYNGTAVEG